MIDTKKLSVFHLVLFIFLISVHLAIWWVFNIITMVGIGMGTAIFLRTHKPEDIEWIAHRHGVIYAEEYGWDETFEALVAEILSQFIHHHNPKRERIWIAEQNGERIGLVMIVDAGEQIAHLRLLLVEPKARNKGVGKRLIDECINFCKKNRYKKIRLWTQSNLSSARHLYSKAGFIMIKQESHKSFGHDLIGETWELSLDDSHRISR